MYLDHFSQSCFRQRGSSRAVQSIHSKSYPADQLSDSLRVRAISCQTPQELPRE